MQSSDLLGAPVIDDREADRLATQVADPASPFSGGYVPRDFDAEPFGSIIDPFSRPIIPRADWPELIRRQQRFRTSPGHIHRAARCRILDQNGYPYCWMFGTVGGLLNRYAMIGIRPPLLSATAPAAQGKRYRKQGGWATEAARYIGEYGVPTTATWPEHSLNRAHASNERQRRDAARHGLVDFEELPSRNFDAAMSALLDPIDPAPVTLGLMWWGHLVLGVRAVIVDGAFGIEIVNSWGRRWKDGGYAVLMENKATAHEYLVIRRVRPRSASDDLVRLLTQSPATAA